MVFTAQQFAERMPDAREGEHYGNRNRRSGNATGPSRRSNGPRVWRSACGSWKSIWTMNRRLSLNRCQKTNRRWMKYNAPQAICDCCVRVRLFRLSVLMLL